MSGGEGAAALPVGTDGGVRSRRVVAVLVACYGVVVGVANARNDVVGTDFTPRRDWVLFGGGSGFPDDFGRNVFAGSMGLGALVVGLAVVVAAWGGTRWARPAGVVTAGVAVVLVAGYRDDGNLLGARPSASAVFLAVALYLVASSLPVPADPPVAGTDDHSDR